MANYLDLSSLATLNRDIHLLVTHLLITLRLNKVMPYVDQLDLVSGTLRNLTQFIYLNSSIHHQDSHTIHHPLDSLAT